MNAATRTPNDDEVICPACAHQFRAIPVNVQSQLAAPAASVPIEPPAHNDHLSQHWDRTCPACIYEAEKERLIAYGESLRAAREIEPPANGVYYTADQVRAIVATALADTQRSSHGSETDELVKTLRTRHAVNPLLYDTDKAAADAIERLARGAIEPLREALQLVAGCLNGGVPVHPNSTAHDAVRAALASVPAPESAARRTS